MAKLREKNKLLEQQVTSTEEAAHVEREPTPDPPPQSMGDKVANLLKRVDELDTSKSANIKEIQKTLNAYENEPLCRTIMDADLPPNFKFPNLKEYDEKSDPFQHCWQIKALMDIYHSNNTAIPRLFKSTQIGRASCRERVCQYV